MQRQVTVTTPTNSQSVITIDDSRMLGKGNYGKVYAGKVTITKKELAVKLIAVCGSKEKQDCDNEIATMKLLTGAKFKNIIQLHGYDFSINSFNSTFTIAMTYAANGTLLDWLTGKRQPYFPPQQQKQIMRGIANGLSYIHEANVIHCDLKTDNILLDDNMEPMICDFGLSKRVGVDDLYNIQGNKLFSSPELLLAICNGQYERHSEKSDMYAFSLLCWCIVTKSEVPYNYYDKRGDLNGLFNWVVVQNNREVIPPEPQCPKQVADVIELGWDRLPEKRPTARQAFKMLSDNQGKREVADENVSDSPLAAAVSASSNTLISTKISPLDAASSASSYTNLLITSTIVSNTDSSNITTSACESPHIQHSQAQHSRDSLVEYNQKSKDSDCFARLFSRLNEVFINPDEKKAHLYTRKIL
ncbi:Serine/threonine-protein kinase PknK [Aquicella siphonis]|uniref:Serine/threonine-protein kinase PknK n=1 Tax=Aquicella siphonis TaxID=254247 RepID=A0A5E4PFZ3_9COXI|nr:protein kinase [Aquicella siphonis]VVC75367.1 Serine/threonine-protein kinase PknK [Aquicella siphonis]